MWDGFASAGTASASAVRPEPIFIMRAGTHLGYMGDTGYSDIPGTTGNFPVHLHFGIYINDENGQELSVNPYPMVLYLWEQQGKYTFGETKRQ